MEEFVVVKKPTDFIHSYDAKTQVDGQKVINNGVFYLI